MSSTIIERRLAGGSLDRPTSLAPRPGWVRNLALLFVFAAVFMVNSGFVASGFLFQLSAASERFWSLDRSFLETHASRSISAATIAGERVDLIVTPTAQLPDIDPETAFTSSIAYVLLALFICLFVSTLASDRCAIGRVNRGQEWLMTLPISTRVLFMARLADSIVGNVVGWLLLTPFLCVIYWCAGYGLASVPLAIAVTVYLQLMLGALVLVTESALIRGFSHTNLKNLQALMQVFGIFCFVGLFGLALSSSGTDLLLAFASRSSAAVAWIPIALPVELCSSGYSAMTVLGGCLALGLVASYGSVEISRILAPRGLLIESGSARCRIQARSDRSLAGWGPLRGLYAKDLRLLVRDRQFLVQTLFAPSILIAYQLVITPGIVSAMACSFDHAAMAAFAIGAFVLMFGAFFALDMEGRSLWILYTFPFEIEAMIRRKALFWLVVASVLPLGVLGWFGFQLEHITGEVAVQLGLVIGGLALYAFIATGLGVLGSGLWGSSDRRNLNPAMIYLFIVLAGLYSWAIYAPRIWNKAVMFLLCLLLAYSIWQKLRDESAYLLDPTQTRPARLTLSDGLTAALFFFVLQGVLFSLCRGVFELATGPSMSASVAGAGCLVALGSLLSLWRRGVPDLLRTLGLPCRAAWNRKGIVRALIDGLCWGVLSFGAAICYLWAVEHIEILDGYRDMFHEFIQVSPEYRWWLLAFCLIIAPIFEEYIFRGMLLNGFRQSMSPRVAILASAVLFTLVHPPVSMIPVFCLGLLTGICFERSRLLLAPIIVHIVYNAAVVLAIGTI